MGLLTKAGSHNGEEAARSKTLDKTWQDLKKRIGKLPEEKSTPYTALGLLKAYGGFQTGICLFLKDGCYSSYTSVGLGIETLSLPQKKLWSRVKARNKYFKLSPAINIDMKDSPKDLAYWVFPLDFPSASPREPWKAVMLLGALESSSFNPNLISAVLDGAADKMTLPSEKKAEPAPPIEDIAVEADICDLKFDEEIPCEEIPSESVSFEVGVGQINLNEELPGEPSVDDNNLSEEMPEEETFSESDTDFISFDEELSNVATSSETVPIEKMSEEEIPSEPSVDSNTLSEEMPKEETISESDIDFISFDEEMPNVATFSQTMPREEISAEEMPVEMSEATFIEQDDGFIIFDEEMSVEETPTEMISGAEVILSEKTFVEFSEELNDEMEVDFISLDEEMSAEEMPSESNTVELATVEKEIILFHQMYTEFNCLVLEHPVQSNSGDDFCETVSAIIDKAGSVIPLPSGRPLILLPLAADRQLIAHRLSKTLNAKNLLSFEANTPEDALNRVNALV